MQTLEIVPAMYLQLFSPYWILGTVDPSRSCRLNLRFLKCAKVGRQFPDYFWWWYLRSWWNDRSMVMEVCLFMGRCSSSSVFPTNVTLQFNSHSTFEIEILLWWSMLYFYSSKPWPLDALCMMPRQTWEVANLYLYLNKILLQTQKGLTTKVWQVWMWKLSLI